MIPAHSSGDLTPTIAWSRWQVSNPIPSDLGAWLQLHKLYARGSDSTALRRGLGATRSTLKRLWSGQKGQHNSDCSCANIWVLSERDRPIGVCVWESQTSAPSPQKFVVNMWLDPAFRQRGLMGALVQLIVEQMPHITHPLSQVHAGDASAPIVQKHLPRPVRPLIIYADDYESDYDQRPKRKRY